MKSRKIQLYFILIFCLLGSCSLDFTPENEVSDPDAITSVFTAQRALASAYASYQEYHYALDLVILSDDMQPTSSLAKNPSLRNTYLWQETALLPLAKSIWENHYETIAKINVLLDRLPNINTATDQENKGLEELKSRALRLKALCYFQLLKVFSPSFLEKDTEDFGILLKKNFSLTQQQERITKTASIEKIEGLLKSATAKDNNMLWLSDDAGKYLQAEVALWSRNYEKALAFALPLYKKYKGLLPSNSPLTVWSNKVTPLRIFACDTRALGINKLYSSLEESENTGDYLAVNSRIEYHKKDKRYEAYSIPFIMNSGAGEEQKVFLLGKYNKKSETKGTVDFYTKFRVAGLYFLCAEAYLHLGNKNKAVEIINELLAARTSSLMSTDEEQDQLLARLLYEKQKEFVGEPERFFDLKRNRKEVKKILGSSFYTIKSEDHRWTLPIPLSEKKHNKKIRQNKGWEHLNIVE